MNKDILIGIVLLAIAGGLLFMGRPSKSGVSPRFLQFVERLQDRGAFDADILWRNRHVRFGSAPVHVCFGLFAT